MESIDEFSFSTGYERKALDLYETSVAPHLQLLDSPPILSDKVSSADPDYDDASFEDMFHQVHRAQASHSPREDLSVCRQCPIVQGDLLEIDLERPREHQNTEAQIRTLLDDQCQARTNQHEFQAVRAEEEPRLLQGQILVSNFEIREGHQISLIEMEELRKFQS